jgi:uracil phosphoribosyltransferase
LEREMGKLIVIDHPLIQHKISMLRDKETSTKDFRELTEEISLLMAYEVTRDLPLKDIEIQTPLAKAKTKVISGRSLGVIVILRAGLGMASGILKLVPNAKVGHIGIYRDTETKQPVEYYGKIPFDSTERDLIIVDPMIATGGSASAAIKLLKKNNCNKIKYMCLVAAKTGVDKILSEFDDVDIYTAAYDEILDEHGYIIPGLGDAGDRLFGTK